MCLWPECRLTTSRIIFIAFFTVTFSQSTFANKYVGGAIGVLFDKVAEFACDQAKGAGIEINACHDEHNEHLIAEAYRNAFHELQLAAEFAKSVSLQLISEKSKNEKSELNPIYDQTKEKLENAIENAYKFADNLPGIEANEARLASHEIYQSAAELLMSGAEQAGIKVSRDISINEPPVLEPVKVNLNEETLNLKEMEEEELEETKTKPAIVVQEEVENFDPIQNSYRRVADAAAEGIENVARMVQKLGKGMLGSLSSREIDEAEDTSLQKVEKAIGDQSENVADVLRKAEDASSMLQMEREIHPDDNQSDQVADTEASEHK